MHYSGNIFRPPAEHDSILLQVTEGCSHNRCRFCGMYKDKRFKIKDESLITEDIEFAAAHYRESKRLFLCDGDAMIIPFERLARILEDMNRRMPWLTRVGIYANAKSVSMKSPDELRELKKLKLGIAYLGLESGDDEVLRFMDKGVSTSGQIEQCLKLKEAGIKLSCTVLLGLGGRERTGSHAAETGRALSVISPNYMAALSLMIIPQAPLYQKVQDGSFQPLGAEELLGELKRLIWNINVASGVFSANHASNYLPLQFRFPSEKDKALTLISKALDGGIPLKPEWMRGL